MSRYLVKNRTFVNGGLRPRGTIVEVDDAKVADKNRNLIPVGDELQRLDVAQISAISPTGPNPKRPQQIPPDAREGIGGFVQPGQRLVGEQTFGSPQARADAEALMTDDNTGTREQVIKTLAGAGDRAAQAETRAAAPSSEAADLMDDGDDDNDDDDLVAGTVKQIADSIDADTDLDALEAAEKDREVPRSGVLKAIDTERARRQSA